MARTNKYTSLNFNDIYEKKTTPNSRPHSSSSSSSNSNDKTIISNSRIHGHMLVLSRPTPKPISIPQPLPIQQQQPKIQSPPPEKTDSISLRPQGSTGSGPVTLSSSPVNNNPVSPLPKSNRFVPPHLRPGFVGREEKPVPGGLGVGPGPNHIGLSPNKYGENGRPKSGGGYERMMNRPGSSGSRPSSSG